MSRVIDFHVRSEGLVAPAEQVLPQSYWLRLEPFSLLRVAIRLSLISSKKYQMNINNNNKYQSQYEYRIINLNINIY